MRLDNFQPALFINSLLHRRRLHAERSEEITRPDGVARPAKRVPLGLLSVPDSTLAGASVARLVRPALSAFRDENLCINRAT